MIRDLEEQLAKKDEEIQYLVRQLDYLQTKYRDKKMQLKAIRHSRMTEDSQSSNYGSKPERDVDPRSGTRGDHRDLQN